MKGPLFREALEEAYPYLRGRIDDDGTFLTFATPRRRAESRFALTPYGQCNDRKELLAFYSTCRGRTSVAMAVDCLTDDYKRHVR